MCIEVFYPASVVGFSKPFYRPFLTSSSVPECLEASCSDASPALSVVTSPVSSSVGLDTCMRLDTG